MAKRTASIHRRQFVYGGALVAAAAVAIALTPRRLTDPIARDELDHAVPNVIGRYRFATVSGLVMPPQDEISERIYDQVLTRVYVADDVPPMMLLIAYGSAQDSGLQLHRPEVCYPASGYEISGIREIGLKGLRPGTDVQATFLTAARGSHTEQVLYWTRIGQHFPNSGWQEKSAIISANIGGSLPDGVLVRVSIQSPDRAEALRLVEGFNTAMVASLGARGRRLLLGSTAA